MSIRLIRRFSTPPTSYGVQLADGMLKVLGPRAPDAVDVFAEHKRASCDKASDKLETAILYTQLRGANRKMVFTERRTKRVSFDEEPSYAMKLGRREKTVKLHPRGAVKQVSAKDIMAVAATGTSSEQVHRSADILQDVLLNKAEYAENQSVFFVPDLDGQRLIIGLLRQAAKTGVLGPIYSQISDEIKPEYGGVHLEMLRIQALSMPYLTKRAKSKLNEYYFKARNSRSDTTSNCGADLLCAYGLVQYGQKYGMEHVTTQLAEIFGKIKQDYMPAMLASPRSFLKQIHVTDFVLGAEAVALAVTHADLAQYSMLVADMAKVMDRLGNNKRLEVVYSVDVANKLEEKE